MPLSRRAWIATGLLALAGAAQARGGHWLVDFKPGDLDRVLLPQVVGKARRQWYCTFSLTNNTGMDRDLALNLFLETDVTQGRGERKVPERHAGVVDPIVQRAVEARTGKTFLDLVQVQGRLRASERKEALVVFGPVSGEADVATIYVGGLSPAEEAVRLGADYEKMIRSGKDVRLVVRAPGGGSELQPLARRVSKDEYKRLAAGGNVRLWRTVTEAEGEVCLVLDHERLAAAEPRRYLERMVLRRRYSRRGDEIQPQLDVYRFDGEDWIVAVEPLAP